MITHVTLDNRLDSLSSDATPADFAAWQEYVEYRMAREYPDAFVRWDAVLWPRVSIRPDAYGWSHDEELDAFLEDLDRYAEGFWRDYERS